MDLLHVEAHTSIRGEKVLAAEYIRQVDCNMVRDIPRDPKGILALYGVHSALTAAGSTGAGTPGSAGRSLRLCIELSATE